MISYQTYRPTSLTSGITELNERHVGGAGGSDWNGIQLDVQSAAQATVFRITLPEARISEGKVIHVTIIGNTGSKNVVIRSATGTSDRIICNAAESSSITSLIDLSQLILTCDGTRWWALQDGNINWN